MPVNRRLFIFGAAAAIATAKAALALPATIIHDAPTHITKPRMLYQINIAGHHASEPATIQLRRALTGNQILQFHMRPRDWGCWFAHSPLAQIAEMPGQILVLSVDGGGAADAWEVEMLYDEDGRGVVERHFFPATRGPMERIAMVNDG